MAVEKIAELMAEIGFSVNPAGLKLFEKRLKEVEQQIKSIAGVQEKASKKAVKSSNAEIAATDGEVKAKRRKKKSVEEVAEAVDKAAKVEDRAQERVTKSTRKRRAEVKSLDKTYSSMYANQKKNFRSLVAELGGAGGVSPMTQFMRQMQAMQSSATGANAKAWKTRFEKSISAITGKSGRSRGGQVFYDKLFEAIPQIQAKAKNADAWSKNFKSSIRSLGPQGQSEMSKYYEGLQKESAAAQRAAEKASKAEQKAQERATRAAEKAALAKQRADERASAAAQRAAEKAAEAQRKAQESVRKATERTRKAQERAMRASERAAPKNRATFFQRANQLAVKTGQGLQYRLGEQQRNAVNSAMAAAAKMEAEAKKKAEQATRALELAEGRRLVNARRQQVYNQAEESHKLRMLGLQQRLANAEKRARQMNGITSGNPNQWGGGLVGAMAAAGAGGFGMQGLWGKNREIVATEVMLESAVGSEEQGKASKQWLIDQARRLGFDYLQVAPEFGKLMASAVPQVGIDEAQRTFKTFSELATVRKMGGFERKRMFYALQQMFSKEKVMTQELQEQMAESGFVDARSVFAEAWKRMGKTSSLEKAMEKGEVRTKEIMPYVLEILDEKNRSSLPKAMKSSIAAMGRLRTEFNLLFDIFSKEGGDVAFGEMFDELADGLNRSQKSAKAFGEAFEILVSPIRAFGRLIGDTSELMSYLSKETGISEKNLMAFSIVAAGLLFPLTRALTVLGMLVLAIEDVATAFQGGDSYFRRFAEYLGGGEFQKGIDRILALAVALATVYGVVKSLKSVGKLEELFGKTGKDVNGSWKDKLLGRAGVQKVFVTNWPSSFGGGGVDYTSDSKKPEGSDMPDTDKDRKGRKGRLGGLAGTLTDAIGMMGGRYAGPAAVLLTALGLSSQAVDLTAGGGIESAPDITSMVTNIASGLAKMPELITFSGDYSNLYNKPVTDILGGMKYALPEGGIPGITPMMLSKPVTSIPGITPMDRQAPMPGMPQMANWSTVADISLNMTLQVENLEDYAKIDEVARLMGERFKVEFDKQLSTAGIQYSGSNLE